MSWHDCGREWHPVLLVLAVLAVLVALALVSPVLGIIACGVAFFGLCVWLYVNT